MTKMNDQSNPSTGDFINQYATQTSNALANIKQMQKATYNIQNETQTLYLCAEENRKRKIYLNQILVSLEKHQITTEPNDFLEDLLQTKNRYVPESIPLVENEEETKMYEINLPDMSWAYNYLQQIQQENFQKVKNLCTHERQNICVLANNLKRYSMRLIEIEQKLKKCYEEARSKRRYI